MPGVIPNPTYIHRLIHIDNLHVVLKRGGMHAPNFVPEDGLCYTPIHYVGIQNQRHDRPVRIREVANGWTFCERHPLHDYVPFYFCNRPPMLLALQRDRVDGYNGGPEPLIYLVSTAQKIAKMDLEYAFSDGHGIMTFTSWYEDLCDLEAVDWNLISNWSWKDTPEDNDRKRRKQAEFLIYRFAPWSSILGIATCSQSSKKSVEAILQAHQGLNHPPIAVYKDWYY